MSEVMSDLKALANLELPRNTDDRGRNIVKLTLLLFSVMVLASFAVVTVALFASLARENDLKNEIGCVRTSSVLIDRRMSEGVSLVIDQNTIVLEGLEDVVVNDTEHLGELLSVVPELAENGRTAQQNLDEAIAAREEALINC